MSDVTFIVGDEVTMTPMWKYKTASGKVIKITADYVVVKWNNVNGDWHYTKAQSQMLKKP